MEFKIKDLMFIATQVVIATTVIVTNKQSINYLKQESADTKDWLKQLQETVTELRVKIGL